MNSQYSNIDGMLGNSIAQKNSSKFSIVRVVYYFHPLVGGSITHILELSSNINPYLKNQIIIAPDFGIECANFDSHSKLKIMRVCKCFRKYSDILCFIKKYRLPFLPLSILFRFLYMLSVYCKVRDLRKRDACDILHSHDISTISYSFLIGKLLKIPVVGMIHGSESATSPVIGNFLETLRAIIFKPSFALVLDDGSGTAKKFKKIWKDRCTIVYHGIDHNFYTPRKKSKKLMQAHNLSPSDYILLSTSLLGPVKNIDLLIESFSIFIKDTKIKNAFLFIAGSGEMKGQLIELSSRLNISTNVVFLGAIGKKEILEYISIADVVVGSSLYSNMNRSIQEAMSCGKPVIVFDSGGIGKLITNMENGILVKSGDLEEFAKMIGFLHENQRIAALMGNYARETIINKRGWNKRIRTELNVYNNCVEDS